MENPPINTLTGQLIHSWYHLGELEGSVLGNSVEQCHALLASYYPLDNKGLLTILGYTDSTSVATDDRKVSLPLLCKSQVDAKRYSTTCTSKSGTRAPSPRFER